MVLLFVLLLRTLWWGVGWVLRLPLRVLVGLCTVILLLDAGDDEQSASGRREWLGPHRPQNPMGSGRFWMGEAGPRWWRRRL